MYASATSLASSAARLGSPSSTRTLTIRVSLTGMTATLPWSNPGASIAAIAFCRACGSVMRDQPQELRVAWRARASPRPARPPPGWS